MALEEEKLQTQREFGVRGRSPARQPTIDLDDMPPESLRKTPSPSPASRGYNNPYSQPPQERGRSGAPAVTPPAIPVINLPGGDDDEDEGDMIPRIAVSAPPPPSITVTVSNSEPPRIPATPTVTPSASSPSTSGRRPLPQPFQGNGSQNNVGKSPYQTPNGSGSMTFPKAASLRCAGCNGLIVGRIVSAIGKRWHPACFKCSQCDELLEHVSSYEHEGQPYCHLDYHDLFAPRCFHCKTSIVDERFITVTDPALSNGQIRYYHELHFFCAECGDPFLHPSASSAAPKGQRPRLHEDSANDVGYTVYRGHPYCEACHVRLRMPKCAGCKKSIRDEIVEALDKKWHFECFTCSGCKRPFEDPSFFQRGDKAFCDDCYRILLRSEI
ncbi:hypothetical protein FRC02_010255 [Tulasnella sp. 418]|nr:hypothetical protein FRC02_010255 [Tulasnella sp. 418]